ncbi:MAG: Uma2 family endonuclease [Planctomycetaceae bacterium]|nr:Uma2 family endonuclease [Planctomycetaceae bacterium]
MSTQLEPTVDESTIIARQRAGIDQFDEVWEGVYVMSPLADLQHQDLDLTLAMILRICIDWCGLGQTFAGVNISDRKRNWRQNYRCPDVAVFLNETRAVAYKAHWYGGPDFGIEIVSENDRTLEKLPFYEQVRTRELLVIERDPWAIQLYRLEDDALRLSGTSLVDKPETLRSQVVPLSFQLVSGMHAATSQESSLPVILITHHDGRQSWRVAPKPHGKIP